MPTIYRTMVQPVPFRSLQTKLFLLLLFLSFSATAQLVKSDSLTFENQITAFSLDRTGNIFTAHKEGRINKFSLILDSLNSYSPSKVGDISLLEAWHGFQIYAFYDEFQDYLLLDRFLTRDTRYELGPKIDGFLTLCTISSDQNLWALEENQLQLMKINTRLREVDLQIPLEPILGFSNHEFTFIREYQNLLFLIDKLSGIYVFDNLGNYLRKIDEPGVNYCSFYKEKLLYITGSSLHVIDLYKNSSQTIELPETTYLGALSYNKKLILVSPKKLEVFEFAMDE
jgi:hypothetical protein